MEQQTEKHECQFYNGEESIEVIKQAIFEIKTRIGSN